MLPTHKDIYIQAFDLHSNRFQDRFITGLFQPRLHVKCRISSSFQISTVSAMRYATKIANLCLIEQSYYKTIIVEVIYNIR